LIQAIKQIKKTEEIAESSQCILLVMSATDRRANVRVHVSKNFQQSNYPRGALIMVAGAGGGNFASL